MQTSLRNFRSSPTTRRGWPSIRSAVDTATRTLYVALDDTAKISEIDTQTLTETTRFPALTGVFDVAVAGGKLWFATAGNWSKWHRVR